MTRAIGLALAPGTRRSYDRAVGQFESFRQQSGYAADWPPQLDHIMHYCVMLRGNGRPVSYIKGHLSALAFAIKARGLADVTGDFRLRKMLEGWAREVTPRVDVRQLITPEVLTGLYRVWRRVCRTEYEMALFHAAALVAFFGALRVSELVAGSRSDRPGTALQLGDVSMWEERISLVIRRSKTDQKGKGALVTLESCAAAELCPVSAMREFLGFRGTVPGWLFCHADSAPLTKYQFWAVTSLALSKLGLQGVKFGTHSFRIGAASTAAAMGYSETAIRRVGRWRSGAFRAYVRPVNKF